MLAAIDFPFSDEDQFVFDLTGEMLFGWELPPIGLRWYAVAYIAGLVLGWAYIALLMRRDRLWADALPPMQPARAEDLLVWMAPTVVIGGRLGFVLFYQPELLWTFPDEPHFTLFGLDAYLPRAVEIWNGGMSFHGGMLLVVFGVLLFARTYDLPVLKVGDAVAAATPIGIFFGRIANFVNGELWGRVTEQPWGVVFPQVPQAGEIFLTNGENLPRHPSQLYEAALEGLLLFAVMSWLVWCAGALKRPGLITGVFFLGYGLARGFAEFFRQWDPYLGFDLFILDVGVTRGQTLCAPMIALGLAFIYVAQRRAAAERAAAT